MNQFIVETFNLPLRNQYVSKFGNFIVNEYYKDSLIKEIHISFLENCFATINIKAEDRNGIYFHNFNTQLIYEELTSNTINIYFYKL